MSVLKIPAHITLNIEAHKKWCVLVEAAQMVVNEDMDLQKKAKKGLCLKERNLPVEVLGRMYAQYCDLINQMYDSYLNCIHLQRAPYMLGLISVLLKRMYELRNELVYLIVNDYIYMDTPLTQLKMTPFDIEIVVPYHFPLEARADSFEQLLQKMWSDAVKRKTKAQRVIVKPPKPDLVKTSTYSEIQNKSSEESIVEDTTPELSVHTIPVLPDDSYQVTMIQRHERFKQWFAIDFKSRCVRRRMYFAPKVEEPPAELKNAAAKVIQKVYREYMKTKRLRHANSRRDIILGMIPDLFRKNKSYFEENNKVYERYHKERERIHKIYLQEMEKENTRLLMLRKDNEIDDITEEIYGWFMEWYYGYGFFPEYPYELEGGTILVIRGDYPTIDEKVEADQKLEAATKGKTKEMLKQEKRQAKADAAMKATLEKEKEKKNAEVLFKARLNPFSDPGYKPQKSGVMEEITEALSKYRAAWSFFDSRPSERYADAIYGYMKSILSEDLMNKMHLECRRYVDQLMRLDLKLLIKMHEIMYKNIGKKYPKQIARKKPKPPPRRKVLNIDDALTKNLEEIFDLNLISKPTRKLRDIWGDTNFAAYDLNVKDPDAKFPPPGYGDIRQRLVLSCIFGSGLAAGAKKNRSVMLVGPPRNGKSFLVDCVAGEMNAVKIDITPEVFSAISDKPAKLLAQVMTAARAFQPAVIYMRNVEKVFAKKVPPEEKYMNAKAMKTPLAKLLKTITADDKIIFIATCSAPSLAKAAPMVSLFDEMILVPVTDYDSLQMFFYKKLQSIRSMPRDYCVQPIAQLFRGYGFGLVIETYDRIITPERIVILNITPLDPVEFLNAILETEIDPVTPDNYKEFLDFFFQYSPLSAPRMEFEYINMSRAVVYQKQAKKEAEDERKRKKANIRDE